MSTENPFLGALIYGTFGLFHVGHGRLLHRIFDLSDRLYVRVSTDEFSAAKGKKAINIYRARAEVVGPYRCVHHVLPETSWGQKHEDIERFSIELQEMGDGGEGHFDRISDLAKVLVPPLTPSISTSEIIDWIQDY